MAMCIAGDLHEFRFSTQDFDIYSPEPGEVAVNVTNHFMCIKCGYYLNGSK